MMSSLMMASAQDVKEVTLSSTAPYDEPLELACDEKGLVLNIRMNYDEDNDILSLALVPDRPVIFYRQDVVYKDIFPSGKTLKTEKLPYAVQTPPASKIKLQNTVYKTYSKKRKFHLYNRWLGNVSAGMVELSPAITEAGETVPLITTDSLFLRFSLNPSVTKVSFKLRNIQTVDLTKKKKNGKTKYAITGEVDLNTTFKINLQRNPCYGMSTLKATVCNQINEVSRAYKNLLQACPDGVALSEEECAIFNEHRKFLETQYPVLDIDTECQDVLAACETYNAYVDSIRNAPCTYMPRNETAEELAGEVIRVPSDVLVSIARKLNLMAVQMLTTKDPVERRDVYYQGEQLIDEMQDKIDASGVSGEDRDRAIQLFSEAVDFWHRITAKIHF